jgi:hypothetical protein
LGRAGSVRRTPFASLGRVATLLGDRCPYPVVGRGVPINAGAKRPIVGLSTMLGRVRFIEGEPVRSARACLWRLSRHCDRDGVFARFPDKQPVEKFLKWFHVLSGRADRFLSIRVFGAFRVDVAPDIGLCGPVKLFSGSVERVEEFDEISPYIPGLESKRCPEDSIAGLEVGLVRGGKRAKGLSISGELRAHGPNANAAATVVCNE